tara:strand:- start:229 stop:996 length:768 start_codon:yes stop_codon:yes gene_type:complete
MYFSNNVKQMLKNGETVLGASMFSVEPNIASQVYDCKPDWVWIDLEHTPWSFETIMPITILAHKKNVCPVIRVGWNDPALIKKAFDIGAGGVMIPQINSAEEAEAAVKYSRYSPLGERGVGPWFATQLGLKSDEIVKNSNNETLLILQMESQKAFNNLDEILEVDGYDVILVGPGDLSVSLGISLNDIHHPKIEAIMKEVSEKALKKGKFVGTTFNNYKYCEKWIKENYKFMNVSNGLELGLNKLKSVFQDLRSL